MSNYGEVHRFRIQRAAGGGSAHSTAAAAAGVLGNSAGGLGRTSGVALRNGPGQGGHKLAVFRLARDRRADAGSGARRSVGNAFLLALAKASSAGRSPAARSVCALG